MRSLFYLIALLATASALAQELANSSADPAEIPRMLTVAGHVKTDVPMFGGLGNGRCDSSDNYVLDAGTGMGERGPYIKISSDGRRHVIFQLPQEVSKEPGNDLWAISPDGTLYVLHDDYQKNQFVRFKDDGTVDAINSLSLPPHVEIEKIAVAGNGNTFVTGHKVTQADQTQATKPEPGFAAIFNADGHMLRDLSADEPEYDVPGSMKHLIEGDLIAGDDGRFYTLSDREVRIVTQSGEIAATWKVTKPEKDGMALRIDESKGTVSVAIYAPRKRKPGAMDVLWPTTILYNAQTGDLRGTYTFDSTTTGSIACYSGQNGYTMGGVDNRMKAFDIVPVR